MDLNFYMSFLLLVRNIITLIGVIIIMLGSFIAAWEFYRYLKDRNLASINTIRMHFGYKIILGLELLVGADIIKSAIQPDYYDLGILAGLVIIRTILSFFLNKELSQMSS